MAKERVAGHDIDERLDQETKMRAWSKAVENSPVSIVITDVQGRIEYVNPRFTSITGYSSEEIKGRKPGILSSGLTSRRTYCEVWATILNGGTWKGEFANRKKSGELYWESASISPILNEEGVITNFVAIKEDITVAKALADQNIYLSEMVTRAVNEIYSFHYDTLEFEFVNQMALDNLGYSMEELKEMTPLDLKVDFPPEQFGSILERLRSGSEAMVLFEASHRRKDGRKYPVEVHLQVVSLRGEKKFLAIINDITYRKRMEQDLRHLNEKAKTLGALTRHDIMNQVTVLLGNLELMREELGGMAENRMSALTSAAHNIEQYVEFAADFDNTGKVSPEWQDLRQVVQSSWTNVGIPQVEMKAELPEIEIMADSMFSKVFDNLFVNSLTHATGLTGIEVRWERKAADAVLIYTDDGPGIPEQMRDMLFKLRAGTRKGLGLFLIKEVLTTTGMDLVERGERGSGVRFEISVPSENWRPKS